MGRRNGCLMCSWTISRMHCLYLATMKVFPNMDIFTRLGLLLVLHHFHSVTI